MADIDTMLAEVKRHEADALAASSAPMPECDCCGDEHDECLDDCAHEQWKLRLGKALRARGEYYRTAAPLLAAEVERLQGEVERLTRDRERLAGYALAAMPLCRDALTHIVEDRPEEATQTLFRVMCALASAAKEGDDR